MLCCVCVCVCFKHPKELLTRRLHAAGHIESWRKCSRPQAALVIENEIFINPPAAHYTRAHTHTNKTTMGLPDCDLFVDAIELHPFVCSHSSSRTAQCASAPLIEMPTAFPSRSVLATVCGLSRATALTLCGRQNGCSQLKQCRWWSGQPLARGQRLAAWLLQSSVKEPNGQPSALLSQDRG